jgi:hypothetical protein
MSDDLYVGETEGGGYGDREQPPTGMQPAIAVRLYPLGWQPGYQGKKPVEKVVYLFELAEKMKTGDFAGHHFRLTNSYIQGLGTAEKPSNLRKDLKSWRNGLEFTPEELKKFNLKLTLLKPCTLNLQQTKKKNGDLFVEIAGILPAPKMDCPDCKGKKGNKACTKCKGRGTVLGMTLWAPETPSDYVPKWVEEARARAVPAPVQQAQADPQVGHLAGVNDEDIPF